MHAEEAQDPRPRAPARREADQSRKGLAFYGQVILASTPLPESAAETQADARPFLPIPEAGS